MTAVPAVDDYVPAGLWSPGDLDDLEGIQTPRIWTPRVPTRRTAGPILSAVDDVFGFDLLPWQTTTADVALELDDDGDWVRNLIVLVVARQNGKTTLLARRALVHLLTGVGGALITAQDRALPRVVFEQVAQAIEDHPDLRRRRERVRYANGTEEVRMVGGHDAPWLRVVAPTQQGFRGYQKVGLLLIDEVREQRTDAVWSAALYTTRAHPNPQVWAVSNAGDPDSVVLNRLRDRGHAAAADPDADPRIGYLEWSAHPDRAPDDPTGWVEANPSLGRLIRGTRLLDELRNDDPLRFRTEALSQWVDATSVQAVPWTDWVRCGERNLAAIDPDQSTTWVSFDVDADRRSASIVAGAWVDDRLVVQEVAHWDDGVVERDVAAALEDWVDRLGPQSVAYDPNTGTGVVDSLSGRGIPFDRITGGAWLSACATLVDLVRSGTLAHADQDSLNRQVAAAGRRDVGDGTFRLSRMDSQIPIPAAIALARLVGAASTPGAESLIYVI